jgi:putative NADH-flavin reductase
MRIAVYGASGTVGREIVAEAIDRGHTVTAVTRNGTASELAVTVRQGDLTDPVDVAAVAADHDVLINAAGGSRSNRDEMAKWPQYIREFALAAGSTRQVYVGGAGSLLKEPGVRLADTPEFGDTYRAEALAGAAALDELRSLPADINWTYLSPAPLLLPGERTGSYQTGTDYPAGERISTADYAIAILDEVEIPKHQRTRFTVAN